MSEFAPFGLILGVIMIISQLPGLVRALFALSWRRTTARILNSHIGQDTYRGDRMIHWSPVIQYEYFVAEKRYVGRRISLTGHGVSNSSRGAARQANRDFIPGRRVAVWYDPLQPSRCALIRGFGLLSPLIFVTGLVLLAIGMQAVTP